MLRMQFRIYFNFLLLDIFVYIYGGSSVKMLYSHENVLKVHNDLHTTNNNNIIIIRSCIYNLLK